MRSTYELRASGDKGTRIESRPLLRDWSPYGQTDWSLAAQARFVSGLKCTREGRAVQRLMEEVVSGNGYGLPAAFPGARSRGGWGPALSL